MCIHDTCVPLQPWLLQPPRLLRLTNLRQSTHTHSTSARQTTQHTHVQQHNATYSIAGLGLNFLPTIISSIMTARSVYPRSSLPLPLCHSLDHHVVVGCHILCLLFYHLYFCSYNHVNVFFCKVSKIENYFLQNILDLDNGWSDTVVVDNSKYSIK